MKKLNNVVLACGFALSVSACAATMPEIPTLNDGSELHLSSKVDKRCLTELKPAANLRSSDIDFALSKDAVESYPVWPLICSMVARSTKSSAQLDGQDIELSFVSTKGRTTILSLQRVESGDEIRPTYQVVAIDKQFALDYSTQNQLLDMMLMLHEQVLDEDSSKIAVAK